MAVRDQERDSSRNTVSMWASLQTNHLGNKDSSGSMPWASKTVIH